MSAPEFSLEDGRKGYCQGNAAKCTLGADECPKFGTLLKANRDGKQRIRGCGDPVYRGKLNRSKGGRAQRQASKALGVPNTSSIRTGHEEFAPGLIRFENKDGAQVGPIFTRFEAVEAQSNASKRFGDTNPFVFTATKGKRTLFLIDAETAPAFCRAFLEQLGEL